MRPWMTDRRLIPPSLGEVHLWILEPERSRHLLTQGHVLSRLERDRALRVRHTQHRQRYIVERAALRLLLANYLGTDPASVCLVRGDNGKPQLVSPSTWLSFNMSHSERMTVVAVGRDRELGIDVEFARDDLDFAALAKRIMSSSEFAAFLGVAPKDRGPVFYRCWTRKEACLKARGDGLSISPTDFDVSDDQVKLSGPEDPVVSGHERLHWTLCDIPVARGYVASLAVQGDHAKLPEVREVPF